MGRERPQTGTRLAHPAAVLAAYRASSGRSRLAWWLLTFSIVNWPAASAVCWVAAGRFDPFQQLMVFYSLAALAFSAVSAINSADAANNTTGGDTTG